LASEKVVIAARTDQKTREKKVSRRRRRVKRGQTGEIGMVHWHKRTSWVAEKRR